MASLNTIKVFAGIVETIATRGVISEQTYITLQNIFNQAVKETGISGGGGGTGDYNDLQNFPTINGQEIKGNLTIQNIGGVAASELSNHTGNTTIHITGSERTAWNGKVDSVTAAIGELLLSVDNSDTKNPKIRSSVNLQQAIVNANSAIQQAQLNAQLASHSSNASAHQDIRDIITEVESDMITDLQNHNTNSVSHQDIRNNVESLEFVKGAELNAGILKLTNRNNTYLEINLVAQSLDVGIDYDSTTKEIILKKSDGTEIGRANISDLVDIYTGSTGTHIQIAIDSNGTVNAVLKEHSVTKTELEPGLVTEIEGKLNKNQGSANSGKILVVGSSGEIEPEDTIEMTAENVSYDNTDSDLQAQNVQDAIDELAEEIKTKTVEVDGVTVIGDGYENPLEVLVSDEDKNAVQKTVDGIYVLDKESKDVPFDNSISGISSDNVQDAIDELNGKILKCNSVIFQPGGISKGNTFATLREICDYFATEERNKVFILIDTKFVNQGVNIVIPVGEYNFPTNVEFEWLGQGHSSFQNFAVNNGVFFKGIKKLTVKGFNFNTNKNDGTSAITVDGEHFTLLMDNGSLYAQGANSPMFAIRNGGRLSIQMRNGGGAYNNGSPVFNFDASSAANGLFIMMHDSTCGMGINGRNVLSGTIPANFYLYAASGASIDDLYLPNTTWMTKAFQVNYNNVESEMLAQNVQEAIDELNGKVNEHVSDDVIHVTQEDRDNWDGMVSQTDVSEVVYGTDGDGKQTVYGKDDFASKEIWMPSINTDGDISFSKSESNTPPSTVNIKGETGNDGYTFVPDWVNRESTSKVNINTGGQWTADSDGFIYVQGLFTSVGRLSVTINGAVNYFVVPVAGLADSRVFPIANGDVISITAVNGSESVQSIGCFFIPPRFVNPS
jgi:hypothetical protein